MIQVPFNGIFEILRYFSMLGKIWGIALLVLGLYVGFEVSQMKDLPSPKMAAKSAAKQTANDLPPEVTPGDIEAAAAEAKIEVLTEPKSEDELKATIASVCQEMSDELAESKFSIQFSEIKVKYRETRLKSKLIESSIDTCFLKGEPKDNGLEIEIFSSGFDGQAANQIQLQVSLFDKDFRNKIFEIGRRFETVKISLARPAANRED